MRQGPRPVPDSETGLRSESKLAGPTENHPEKNKPLVCRTCTVLRRWSTDVQTRVGSAVSLYFQADPNLHVRALLHRDALHAPASGTVRGECCPTHPQAELVITAEFSDGGLSVSKQQRICPLSGLTKVNSPNMHKVPQVPCLDMSSNSSAPQITWPLDNPSPPSGFQCVCCTKTGCLARNVAIRGCQGDEPLSAWGIGASCEQNWWTNLLYVNNFVPGTLGEMVRRVHTGARGALKFWCPQQNC